MSEIERAGLQTRGMTREGIATSGPALEAASASQEAHRVLARIRTDPSQARQAEVLLARLEDAVRAAPALADRYADTMGALRDAIPVALAPMASPRRAQINSAGQALVELRRGNPQTAARTMIGGRSDLALRSMNILPDALDAQLERAGFSTGEKADLHEALSAEIGRRFHGMVRREATQQVQGLLRQLDAATRGDPEAIESFEQQLFGPGGQHLLARLELLGAESVDALRVHVEHQPRRASDRQAARPLMLSALRELRERVSTYRDAIVEGREGNSARWGEAYRAFDNSVHRQAIALGVPPDVDLSGPRMKNGTVLERAIRSHIQSAGAEHDEALEQGRAAFDLSSRLLGRHVGLVVRTSRQIGERRLATLAAQQRAIVGVGSLTTARDLRAREIADAAHDIATGAFNSLVQAGIVQPAGERVRLATERAVREVLERGIPNNVITPENVARAVERLAEKALSAGITAGRRALEGVVQ